MVLSVFSIGLCASVSRVLPECYHVRLLLLIFFCSAKFQIAGYSFLGAESHIIDRGIPPVVQEERE